nr:MAG TPA: hypothetical protein [Caudoviricetes sp.]
MHPPLTKINFRVILTRKSGNGVSLNFIIFQSPVPQFWGLFLIRDKLIK